MTLSRRAGKALTREALTIKQSKTSRSTKSVIALEYTDSITTQAHTLATKNQSSTKSTQTLQRTHRSWLQVQDLQRVHRL